MGRWRYSGSGIFGDERFGIFLVLIFLLYFSLSLSTLNCIWVGPDDAMYFPMTIAGVLILKFQRLTWVHSRSIK